LPLHDFQMVTLMSIAETTLLHCRAYAGRTELPLKLIDDVRDQPLELQKSVVIYSSPANTGANELEGVMRKQIIEDDAQILAKSRRSRVGKSSFGRGRRVSTERRAAFEWVESDLGTATHFLLYLNKKTFDANADALVTDIHDALAQGKPVLLIHENNTLLHKVPFATILGNTPQSLIDAQLYDSLAIPWYPPGKYQDVSIKLALKELGATYKAKAQRGAIQRRVEKAWKRVFLERPHTATLLDDYSSTIELQATRAKSSSLYSSEARSYDATVSSA